MTPVVMPDLQREAYYAREPRALSDEVRQQIWALEDYAEARRLLRERELVPALTVEECVEALTDAGIPPSRIEIVPVGIERAWQGEVVGQYPPPGEAIEPDTPVRVFVSHPSLKDRLPPGFVDRTPRSETRDAGSTEAWGVSVFREQLEAARREETPAERMLRVLESAIWGTRLETSRVAAIFEGLADDTRLAEYLVTFLGDHPEGIAEGRLRWLGNWLWCVNRAIGPSEDASGLLTALLGMPVRIEITVAAPAPLQVEDQTPLGSSSCRLGGGAVLGEFLDDRCEQVEVWLGPLTPSEAVERIRSNSARAALNNWVEALLPAAVPRRLRFEITKLAACPNLGASHPGSILGVTSRLAPPAAATGARGSLHP